MCKGAPNKGAPVDEGGEPNGEAGEAVDGPNGVVFIEDAPNMDCSGLGTLPKTLVELVVEGDADALGADIPNPLNIDVADDVVVTVLPNILDDAVEAGAADPPKILAGAEDAAGLPNVDIEKRF